MNNFYNKIRDQITQLPQKETTEQDWQRFLKHRNSQLATSSGDKKRILLIVFLAMLILSVITNYLLHQDVKQIKQEVEAIKSSRQEDINTDKVRSSSIETFTKNTHERNIGKTIFTPEIISPEPKPIQFRSESNSSNRLEENNISHTSTQAYPGKSPIADTVASAYTTQATKNNELLKADKQKQEAVSSTTDESFNKNNLLSIRPTNNMQEKIAQLHLPLYFVQDNSIKSIAQANKYKLSQANISLVDLSIAAKQRAWSIGLYRSLNLLKDRQLEENFAIANGLIINYRLKRNLTLGVYSNIQESEYVSDVTIDAFGLRATTAPRPNQELNTIEAEIHLISAGLSFTYHKSLFKGMSYYLGPSLGFTKELSRELEYEFEGESENEDEDDDTVIENNDPLILYPWTFRLETGLNYTLPFRLQANLGITYQNQLLKGKERLPVQYGLKLGICKDL